MKTIWTVAIFYFAAVAIPAISLAEDASLPDLSGKWTLNASQSTDLDSAMGQGRGGRGEGMGRGGPGGGMGRGGRGGPPGGGGPGGRGGQDEARNSQVDSRREEMKKQIASLEIFQEGDELNLTNGLDITQLIYTDGRTHKIWTQHGEAEASSHWEDRALVLSIQNDRAPEPRVRRFTLSEDGNQLIISEQRPVPGQENPVTINLVYDRK
jgi:hypothetical protein